jgi:ubiquinone/menaquinone biosynthesis C-methylase UbiE
VDASNPQATFVGDLSHAPQLPDAAFDCVVLTQTLHLIYDFKGAIATCYRILKPGGALLLTVPGITHIDQGSGKTSGCGHLRKHL